MSKLSKAFFILVALYIAFHIIISLTNSFHILEAINSILRG